MVQRLSLLYNFIQQSLNSDSVQAQILLAICQRFNDPIPDKKKKIT